MMSETQCAIMFHISKLPTLHGFRISEWPSELSRQQCQMPISSPNIRGASLHLTVIFALLDTGRMTTDHDRSLPYERFVVAALLPCPYFRIDHHSHRGSLGRIIMTWVLSDCRFSRWTRFDMKYYTVPGLALSRTALQYKADISSPLSDACRALCRTAE